MTDVGNVYDLLDKQHAEEPATTRRGFVAATAGMLGGMGLLAMPGMGLAASAGKTHIGDPDNNPQTILNVAATAEVLATIVNTLGFENAGRLGLDAATRRNIESAAREELIHYDVLVSDAVGGKPATKRIWVPNDALASRVGFLQTVIVGDQIFINAYLLGLTVFARGGGLRGSRFARYLAEFMGTEAVHRALALQSLGRLGNDRAFIRFAQKEEAPGLPSTGQPGFYKITDAVTQLEAAGFGFGKEGNKPGTFYDFDQVRQRTPNPPEVNTRTLS